MRIFVVKKNTIIRAAVFLLLIIGAIVYTQVAFVDAAPASNQAAVMPVCSVATEEKVVAITFDTAFGDTDYTDEILAALEKESAPATFFVMGLWAEKYPKQVDAIAESGNEVASHSMSHKRYTELSTEEMLADAAGAADALFDMTGFDTKLLRMPYGTFNSENIMALKQEGYIPVKWSLDSKDWKGVEAEKVADTVLSSVKSGDIVMFQNNMAQTPEALSAIILGLREQGFKLVTVSDLLLSDDYYVDQNGIQRATAN